MIEYQLLELLEKLLIKGMYSLFVAKVLKSRSLDKLLAKPKARFVVHLKPWHYHELKSDQSWAAAAWLL